MAWNMLQCIDSSDEFKLINSYLFVRLNPSLDPKRDRIVRSSNRNIKIILYIIIIPLFCIVINRFWLLIKFINPLLSLLLLQGTYLKYFHPTRRITIHSEREVHGTRKHCNHRFHTVAKLRFDAGWSVLRSCKYTSDRFLFESLPPLSRMFHGSRSSAIPFYLLFRNSRYNDNNAPRIATSYSRSSFLTTFRERLSPYVPPLPSLPPITRATKLKIRIIEAAFEEAVKFYSKFYSLRTPFSRREGNWNFIDFEFPADYADSYKVL